MLGVLAQLADKAWKRGGNAMLVPERISTI
jgi:hypothetical protein